MRFKYNALNNKGKEENGFIEADAEDTAKGLIKSRALFLVSLKEIQKKSDTRKKGFSFGMKQRLPIQLARQLA